MYNMQILSSVFKKCLCNDHITVYVSIYFLSYIFCPQIVCLTSFQIPCTVYKTI